MTHEHEFSRDPAGRMRCACGTYLFQHAPDHPYGSQAGPNGLYARWCLRDDCDWRSSHPPTASESGRVQSSPNRNEPPAAEATEGLVGRSRDGVCPDEPQSVKGRVLTACGNPEKHGPHDECVGIPLPPIRDEVGPGVAEALRADVIRQLAWTEAETTPASTAAPSRAKSPTAPADNSAGKGEQVAE